MAAVVLALWADRLNAAACPKSGGIICKTKGVAVCDAYTQAVPLEQLW